MRCLLIQMKELCIEPGTCASPANDGWRCADDDGHAMKLLGDVPDELFAGLSSGMTYLDISAASIANGGHAIQIEDGATFELTDNWDDDEELARHRGLRGIQRRNLLAPVKTGAATVLVVRVEDVDGDAPEQSEAELAAAWFGPPEVDQVNMVSK